MKKYNLISDPGHGWLKVKHSEIIELGLEDKITPYSFMDATHVYLEEDLDAQLFIGAKELTNKDIKETYTEKFNRSLANYNPKFLNSLALNVTVTFHGDIKAKVVELGKRIRAITPSGKMYRIPASNPFLYIKTIGDV